MRLATHFGVIGNDVGKTIKYCHALDIKYLCSGHWTDNLTAFKEQFAREGITLAMMELGWLREDMLFEDAPKKSELQDFFDKVKRIGDAGIEMGHVFCALKTSGNLDDEWNHITRFYLELGELAEKHNVKIANHAGWAPEYIVKDNNTFKKFLDAVPNKYIGINMCLGCLQIVSPEDIQQDIDKTLETLGDRMFLIHIRDIRVEEGNKWVDVAMGQGEINLPLLIDRFVEVSKRTGLDPIVLPEHAPKVVDEKANEIAMAWALGYVSGMLKQKEWMS
jgi:sugar phosphate isomerase/epimerase